MNSALTPYQSSETMITSLRIMEDGRDVSPYRSTWLLVLQKAMIAEKLLQKSEVGRFCHIASMSRLSSAAQKLEGSTAFGTSGTLLENSGYSITPNLNLSIEFAWLPQQMAYVGKNTTVTSLKRTLIRLKRRPVPTSFSIRACIICFSAIGMGQTTEVHEGTVLDTLFLKISSIGKEMTRKRESISQQKVGTMNPLPIRMCSN